MELTDLHFHLLPGVDDGPRTLDESAELAAAAAAQGTRMIVATPHVRRDFLTDVSDLRERVREVEERLALERIGVAVVRGAELGHEMVGRLAQSELEEIAVGPPGGRWLLVESPFAGFDESFTAATDELRDRGFAVVVAHPERTRDSLLTRRTALRHELASGSLLQVNAQSLTGRHGEEARASAVELLRSGWATLLASDAHGGSRPPALPPAVEHAVGAAGMDEAAARRLASSAPRRLLECGLRVPAFAVA